MPQSPYDQQLAAIRARQATDGQVNLAAGNVNPGLVQGTIAHANAYPFISPQTAYALAQTGAQPGDPLAQTVATGVLNHKGGGFWGELGHIVTAPMRAAAHFASTALSDAGTVAQPIARGLLTAAETPFQVGAGALRDVASAGGDIVGGIASGAAAGAGIGLIGGAETGPGALVTGAIGGVVGGILGGVAQAKGVEVKGGFVNPLSQSTGGLAVENILSGNKVDLGSGYLPGGALRDEQIKNAQAAASINGHALTPGRMLASALVRPGTTPYNMLSGITDAVTQWNLDPTRYLGEDIAAARGVGKVIPGAAEVETAGPISSLIARRAGILDTADPAVHTEQARQFLQTDGAAQRFIAKAAATDSAAEIRAASNGKISASIANQLAAHTTEQGVLDTLLAHVDNGDLQERAAVQAGKGIVSTFTATRPGARLNQVMERLGGFLPDQTVDLLDLGKENSPKLDTAVDQLDNFLKQGRVAAADRAPALNRLMTATTPEEASRVIDTTVNGMIRDRLLALNHDPAVVDRYLNSAKADVQLLTDTTSKELAGNTIARFVNTGAEDVPLSTPNQVMEYAKYTYHLPDPSDLRRLTTPQSTKIGEGLSSLYNSDAWKESTHAGDWFMQQFKKGVTIRPALALRTFAAQHAKFAANGVETAWSDPGFLFRMVTNPDFRQAWQEGLTEGTPLAKAEGMQKIMRGMSGGFTAEDQAAHQIIVGPGHDLFPQAWGSRIAELHADPVARSIAGQGFDATAESFWDGPLASERHQIATDLNRLDLSNSKEAADAYVKEELAGHLTALTADNPHLMEAIATGRIPTGSFDEASHVPLLADGAHGVVNPDAVDHLAGMALDDSIRVPAEVPAAKDTKLLDPDFGHKVGRMTNWFYSTLIGKPMDLYYQSPALNQLYWESVGEQAHLLNPDGVEKLAARIGTESNKVRIPVDARATLEAAIAHPNAGQGVVPLSRLDELAQVRAVDKLQGMTIDMAKKTGWQDAARLMVPFGKHWQQEITQWAKLAADQPDAFRKAQMTVQGAIGSGFFHKNDYGEYVFNYPGSELVSKVVTGTPTPLTAKASGLSMMTSSLLPGVGPLVSIPASKILPNKPEYDEIRNFLSPFGDPTQKGVLSAVEPAWAKTVQTALANPENDRDAGNTTMQVAKYLVSTGKYSTDTPEAQAKLLADAGSRAKKLLVLQALGKFVLPSSPSLQAVAEAKGTFAPDGRTVTAKLLSDDLQAMRKADFPHSTENFLAKYGDSAMLFLQGATRPVSPGAADTKEQDTFIRANPDIAAALPNSAAYFAPQGAQTFDPASIARQIHMGDRQALTPKQQVALANDQVGSMIYYTKKAQLGPRISTAQQQWLSGLKDALMQDYPGFGTITPGLSSRVTDSPQNVQAVLIPEVRKALDNPKTANSDTGQALATYMTVRDNIDQMGQQAGLKAGSFAQSTKMEAQRQYLRHVATALGQESPGFSMLFDRVLSRELRTDTNPTVPPVSA
jgi:hypothetical protein